MPVTLSSFNMEKILQVMLRNDWNLLSEDDHLSITGTRHIDALCTIVMSLVSFIDNGTLNHSSRVGN